LHIWVFAKDESMCFKDTASPIENGTISGLRKIVSIPTKTIKTRIISLLTAMIRVLFFILFLYFFLYRGPLFRQLHD